MKLTFVLVQLFLIVFTVNGEDDAPIVEIPQGKLQGIYLKSRNGTTYSAFMGIPYGKSEKFELSEPASNWEGIRDASKFGPICPQFSPISQKFEGSLDCLLVNVFTTDVSRDLPVLVFIHGGGFQFGQSNENGADYLMDEEIVFVSINYRLASLGFLSTGDDVLPGNLGLKDQLLALKWVQKNIKYFGGDPEKVTLFGESAGGGSVSYHVISPQSAGLFRYAICQSGTALNPWAYIEEPKIPAFQLAKNLNCPTDSSANLKKCLKEKSVEELVTNISPKSALSSAVIFGPTRENPSSSAFITESPQKSYAEGRFSKIPMVYTVNEDEGLLSSAPIMKDDSLRQKVDKDWMEIAPELFLYDSPKYSKEKKQKVSKSIRKQYFKDQPVSEATFQNLTDVFSDGYFIYHTRNTILSHAKHAPVYIAVLGYRGIWSQIFSMGYTKVIGVAHADDLQYLFNNERYPTFQPKSQQELVSKLFVKAWANFAEYGDPNFQRMDDEPGAWKPVTEKEVETCDLNWLYLKMFPKFLTEPLGKRMKFWDRMYKKLNADDTPKKEEL